MTCGCILRTVDDVQHPITIAETSEKDCMDNTEPTQTDVAEWVASLLPPDLWERYCYLTYARMAEMPELTEFADTLRMAEKQWYRAYTRDNRQIIGADLFS